MAVPCHTPQRSEGGWDSARATSLKIIVVLQVAVPTPVPVGQACHTPQRSEEGWDSARGYLSKELQGH